MKYSSEELNKIYDALPEELKDAIFSVDNAHIINNIGRKYNLHIDQIGEVAEETGLVLLGVTHPTEFVSSVTKRLGIDRVIASQIASEVNEQIFLGVREILKQAQRGPTETTEGEEGPQEVSTEPQHPSKDALMAAIEHPEGMLKRAMPKKEEEIPLIQIKNLPTGVGTPIRVGAEMGKDVPVIAQAPSIVEVEERVTPKKETLGDTRLNDTIGQATSSGRSDIQATPPVPSRIKEPVPSHVEGDILTQKMSGQFSMPKVETKVEVNSAPTTTPGKKFDPYKEAI